MMTNETRQLYDNRASIKTHLQTGTCESTLYSEETPHPTVQLFNCSNGKILHQTHTVMSVQVTIIPKCYTQFAISQEQQQYDIGEGKVAFSARSNPFQCTLYQKKICLNQEDIEQWKLNKCMHCTRDVNKYIIMKISMVLYQVYNYDSWAQSSNPQPTD